MGQEATAGTVPAMSNEVVVRGLIVTAAPDERDSTQTLRVILAELDRRSDVEVGVWLLRATPQQTVWPGALVVDSLRDWAPARLVERLAVPRVPAALRGARLRYWNRRARPDFVLLDDGLGERVLVGTPGDPVIVRRVNEIPPVHADWEAAPHREPDVVAVPPGLDADVPEGATLLAAPHVRDYSASRRHGAADQRRRVRTALGVGVDAPLVTGWGSDGWIDGPELFVRTLWSLEHFHGVAADGLWLGLGADPHEVDRLAAEAERCGVGGRIHFRSADTLAARCCGDAVLLPYRSAGEATDVLAAVAAGLVVVTFPSVPVVDPQVAVVADLDVDEAATALVVALESDRATLTAQATDRLDVGPWVDRLLVAVRGSR